MLNGLYRKNSVGFKQYFSIETNKADTIYCISPSGLKIFEILRIPEKCNKHRYAKKTQLFLDLKKCRFVDVINGQGPESVTTMYCIDCQYYESPPAHADRESN
jgi:hypothetical protein